MEAENHYTHGILYLKHIPGRLNQHQSQTPVGARSKHECGHWGGGRGRWSPWLHFNDTNFTRHYHHYCRIPFWPLCKVNQRMKGSFLIKHSDNAHGNSLPPLHVAGRCTQPKAGIFLPPAERLALVARGGFIGGKNAGCSKYSFSQTRADQHLQKPAAY